MKTFKMKSKVRKIYSKCQEWKQKNIYLLKGKSTDSNLAGNILIFLFNISHLSSKYEIFIISGHRCALTICLYQCEGNFSFSHFLNLFLQMANFLLWDRYETGSILETFFPSLFLIIKSANYQLHYISIPTDPEGTWYSLEERERLALKYFPKDKSCSCCRSAGVGAA